jgi:hypothetical protein
MGLCADGFWGFLSTERPQNHWASFNLRKAIQREESHLTAEEVATGNFLHCTLLFSGILGGKPWYSVMFLVGFPNN